MPANPTILKNCVRPRTQPSDWCGASSVDCLALETSIKPGMLCLRASQIWSHLICGRRLQMLWTDIYLNRVCVKVYEIRVFKVYLEIKQWRLGKANLLGMTACGLQCFVMLGPDRKCFFFLSDSDLQIPISKNGLQLWRTAL